MDTKSHPKCWGQDGHVCQEPSGRACIDCGEPAGTSWGPLWCPDCDVKRLDKISASLESIAADHLRNAALSEKGANMATVAEPVVFEIPTQCRNCQCGIRWQDELGEFVHWANEKSGCPSDAELASYRPEAS